jgi:hypothetical protein
MVKKNGTCWYCKIRCGFVGVQRWLKSKHRRKATEGKCDKKTPCCIQKETDPREEYFEAIFGWLPPSQSSQRPLAKRRREIVAAALNRAEEIRRFEIGLYWQRSLYFWGFNIAIFAGFGAFVTDTGGPTANGPTAIQSDLVALSLALLGLFITIAWLFVNEGAKAWQESWEIHVALDKPRFAQTPDTAQTGGCRNGDTVCKFLIIMSVVCLKLHQNFLVDPVQL